MKVRVNIKKSTKVSANQQVIFSVDASHKTRFATVKPLGGGGITSPPVPTPATSSCAHAYLTVPLSPVTKIALLVREIL
jgi:hypothetical protein